MKKYLLVIGIFAGIIIALILLTVFFQRTLEMEMAEQFNKQQLLLADADATNIQDYLQGIKDEVLHIADSVSLSKQNTAAQLKTITNPIFKNSDNIKKGIELLDRDGNVFFSRGSIHIERSDEKALISGVRKLCPGGVLVQQDTKILSIRAPVCRYDSLTGVVLLFIDIQDLSRAFLTSKKSAAEDYAWMIDDKGNLLYHSTHSNMIGKNLYKTDSSCFTCHRSFEVEKKIIEGKSDYCSGGYYGRYVAPTGQDSILAYSSVLAGDARWIVAVSAPYSEVTKSIRRSMRFYAWIIILIFIATIVVSATVIVSRRKREKAEERAKYEKELEMMHAEKLAALERLTSGITSEIGNPLTSVFSFLDVLMGMEEDEFKKETLETTFFHMNKIADILKQLSCFSKASPEFTSCKVNTIIESSLCLIQYDKRVQNITIMRELQPEMPAIKTDENQLSQVIVNLVLNAADAMPNGGTLTIRSRVRNSGIAIDFEDTGVGIAKENLNRIFDPFYTTKKEGTGLGLAVSYSIVKQLKGSLTVESEPGKGSRFMIHLPIQGEESINA